MKTLNRYVWKNAISPFFLGFFGFIIFVSVNLLYFLSLNIIDYGIPPWRLFQLLYFFLPELSAEAIPVGVLLSIFWILSQMSTKNELMALQVNGVSFKSVVIPFLIFGLLLSFFTFFLNDYLIPEFNTQKEKELSDFMSENIGYSTISNKFLPITGNKYFYVKQPIDNETLDDVIVYEIEQSALKTIFADELRKEVNTDSWIMVDGQVVNLDDERGLTLNVDFDVTEFEELSEELSDSLKDAMSIFSEVNIYGQQDNNEQRLYKYSTSSLLFNMLSESDEKERAFLELNSRFAKSLSPFIIALLGTSICLVSNIKSKSWSIVISFLLIGTFKSGEIFMQSVALHNVASHSNTRYQLNPSLAVWAPDLIFLFLGLLLFILLDSKIMYYIKERFVRK
ncbi:MAG: hypothetical protein PWQ84_113 [Thermotogaceae bacterium]|nr:hypothetical protein [Thermotogaceae bacterium]